MVTMEERASGIAATAKATANIRESKIPIPLLKIDNAKTRAEIIIMIIASFALNLSRLSCKGVFLC